MTVRASSSDIPSKVSRNTVARAELSNPGAPNTAVSPSADLSAAAAGAWFRRLTIALAKVGVGPGALPPPVRC